MLEIVSATKQDISTVSFMEQEMFSDGMSARALTDSLNTDLFLVLKQSGIIYGYFLGRCLAEDMEIYRIAVLPGKRRQGYGQMLLNEAIQLSKQLGVKQCFLEVRESNVAAQKLYHLFGFQQIDRRRRFYRMPDEDAIVMMSRWE